MKAKSNFHKQLNDQPFTTSPTQPRFNQWRDVRMHVLALFEGQGITDWLMEAQGSQLVWTVPS